MCLNSKTKLNLRNKNAALWCIFYLSNTLRMLLDNKAIFNLIHNGGVICGNLYLN